MSDSRQIYIIGQNRLQNDLICDHVIGQMGLSCRSLPSLDRLPQNFTHKKQRNYLLLLDCQGYGCGEVRDLLSAISSELTSSCLTAFFSLSSSLEIENSALSHGVRGFFYETDSAAKLVKGIEILFSGDYWVSRQKLIDCLVLGNGQGVVAAAENSVGQILTSREIEILSRVALGESNELIAENLYISPH
ncbi:MAG: LuxR C-terminal-related transcriptional regulator, partial [Geopsychrobacter sp.]|nr:LuxR C-terminal-related transcriptional regulator [Geopsychrobacter sp.]